MPLASGTRLGPYEILALIGAGGMGEVYRARDTRLDRIVAIKASKTQFSERFEREAHAVATLNHPNVCQLYDLGSLSDEGGYLVMEYIDGSPIAPVDSSRQLLDLAVQIADGMAAAHSAGFTHRDLKPDNILVTGPRSPHPGRVKILDFGLAKLAESLHPSENTQTMTAVTNPGMVVGTVPYMSPEQARGVEVDARSDQFSFGLILYELAAGKRAFTGGSAAETMAAIIRDEAEPLPTSVPAPLRWVVERCLAKDPAERYDSTRDLYRELKYARERLSESSGMAWQAAPLAGKPRGRVWIAALAGLAIAAAAFGAGWLVWRTPDPSQWSGITLGGSEIALNPRMSPDGHLIAFQAMVDGLTQVAVMKPESGNWSVLTRDRSRGPVVDVSWSPDGTVIYYDRVTDVPKGVFSVPVLGGDEQLVVENAGLPEALPDGTLLIKKLNADRETQLHRFWPGTGRLQALPIQMAANALLAPRATPDGKAALVFGEPMGQTASVQAWYMIDLISGSTRRLSLPGPRRAGDTAASDAYVVALSRDGKSVFAAQRSGVLTGIIAFSTTGGGVVRPLLTVSSIVRSLDAGPDGSIYACLQDRPVDLVRSLPDGTQSERLVGFPQRAGDSPGLMAVLPDGRAILPVQASGRTRLMAIQKGKVPAAMVNTTEDTSAPFCTCGPHEVAFMVGPAPRETIAFAEPASGRVVHRIAPAKGPVDSLSCSPDGKTLYFAAQGVIWSIPAAGGDSRKIRAGDSVIADPSGRRLIVEVVESSKVHQFSVPLDGGAEREIPLDTSVPVGRWPLSPSALNADGRLLATLAPPDSWFDAPGIIDTATGRITRIPSDNQSDDHSMGWTPDGKVVIVQTGLRATLWKFQPAPR